MKVYVKTNILPWEIKVYDDKSRERSPIAELFRIGVVIRDDQGRLIVAYPEYPATSPLFDFVSFGLVAGIAYMILRRWL